MEKYYSTERSDRIRYFVLLLVIRINSQVHLLLMVLVFKNLRKRGRLLYSTKSCGSCTGWFSPSSLEHKNQIPRFNSLRIHEPSNTATIRALDTGDFLWWFRCLWRYLVPFVLPPRRTRSRVCQIILGCAHKGSFYCPPFRASRCIGAPSSPRGDQS